LILSTDGWFQGELPEARLVCSVITVRRARFLRPFTTSQLIYVSFSETNSINHTPSAALLAAPRYSDSRLLQLQVSNQIRRRLSLPPPSLISRSSLNTPANLQVLADISLLLDRRLARGLAGLLLPVRLL